VEEGGADALFGGDTAPARLLRALVDPARLVPKLEVETRRETRRALLPDEAAEIEIDCDRSTAREGDLSSELFSVTVRVPDEAGGAREALRALAETYRLRLAAEGPLERARRSLAETELDWLEEAVRAARRVAVAVWRAGRVVLLREGAALRVPVGPGTGVEAARRALRKALGDADWRLRRLGTGPGTPRQPATEVWLAEPLGPLPGGTEGIAELPLEELLQSVGSPGLRDDAALATLHVLARSALPAWAPDALEGGETEREAEAAARAALRSAGEVRAGDEALTEDDLPAGSLLNMELSALAFNRRVLALAEDAAVPLLERVKFLSIFGANLDEFFRVRVAAFKRQASLGSDQRTIDGVTPREQLDAIGVRARRLVESAYAVLQGALLPALEKEGIEIVSRADLKRRERHWLRDHYDERVHALLTPLAAGPGHPFPHIRNQRPAIVAVLREPVTGAEHLGVVELPDGLPRFVRLEDEGGRFVALEAIILDNLPRLYPGMEVESACTFRVTRSAELTIERAGAADLLEAVEEQVRRRRFRPVVRVEVEDAMPARLRDLLLRELRYEAPEDAPGLSDEDVFEVPRLIDLRGMRELASAAGRGDLGYPPEEPREVLDPERPVFDALQEREVLVYFPLHSFEATVERFVLEAADDPDVVAIKLALYRTNRRSRIVEAMRRASARGKQVVALVELTARFDEQRNVEWARYLRSSGIHVIYGIPGLKIHAKVALVVRREKDGVRRYAYIGTGNLNAATASAYTDLGLLTSDPTLGEDANDLFNVLTGAGGAPAFRRLLVAPWNLRRRFVEMIDREAAHARAGREARITVKLNGLADREMIAALYRASRAGVEVDLIVRTICSLRPGVAGLSETIRVISILGRHLEHARIFRFANGGDPEHYIGSSDWRTRNLSRRVELVAPVRDPAHRAALDALLAEQLARPDAWELGADGTYYRRPDQAPRDPVLPPPDPDRVPIIIADP
ncbi:MAG TPA: polyphosphate kinase 1, partial [Longimicrobium sp.]|nr:polyphosphate kinase 1 [Longimicrobium sp.]